MASKSLPALGLETEYGEKIDRCVTDTLLKAGAGLLVGGVLSFTLFKRRAWPITLGTGIGLGIAYRNCEDNLRSHYLKKYDEVAPAIVGNAPAVIKIDTSTSTPERCDECAGDHEDKPTEINLDAAKQMAESFVPVENIVSEEDDKNLSDKNL